MNIPLDHIYGRMCTVPINGGHDCIEIGKRIDLKIPYVPFRLGKLFEDRKQCFLDVVDIDAPKGADAMATFRLHCIKVTVENYINKL